MFDLVHKHKRIIQGVIILLIIPFAFFGLEAYTSSRSGGSNVAQVDGEDIGQQEFSRALSDRIEQLRRALGGRIDPSALDTPLARQAVLESLIEQRVLAKHVLRHRAIVTDDALREAIAAMPAFQQDGRFSPAYYETLLQSQGMSEIQFETRMRLDLSTEQIRQAVSDAAIVPRSVAMRLAALESEQREISESVVSAKDFLSKVSVTPEAVRKHYESALEAYRAPERVRVEYLVLSAEALGRAASPDEAEVKAAYEARASQFRVPEQRRASHILISVAADATPEVRAAARQEAQKLLEQVRKTPEQFAELARKHSKDPGSAAKGGDLGLFGRGMMVKAFEDAAFSMKAGETSDLVESEFGFHIIRLVGIEAERARPLEDVRKTLVEELQRQKGARKFAEAAEAFSNIVYEQADSLKPAAERFKLAILTSEWLTRTPGREDGPLSDAKLRAAIFSADSLTHKRNTEAIEVSANTLVSARVIEHQQARQKTLDEVRSEIEARLRDEQAASLARAEGEARLARLLKGEAPQFVWENTRLVSRRDPKGLDAAALRQIASVNAAALPAYVGLARGADAYVIYRVSKRVAAEAPSESEQKALLAAIQRQTGAVDFGAYLSELRRNADIKRFAQNLETRP